MKLQAEFMHAFDTNALEDIREYEAGVDLFSGRWGIDFQEAFRIIEQGPVVLV